MALGGVAQVRPRSEVDRRGELRQEVVGHDEVQIEPGEIPIGLARHLVDLELREEHPALGVVEVGQGVEAFRPEALVADIQGGHGSETLPTHAVRKLVPDACLDGFAP